MVTANTTEAHRVALDYLRQNLGITCPHFQMQVIHHCENIICNRLKRLWNLMVRRYRSRLWREIAGKGEPFVARTSADC